jgi:hypothetical protein
MEFCLLTCNRAFEPRDSKKYSIIMLARGQGKAIVLTIIGYMIGIRQVIGFLFSLELTSVFNNGLNVTLITNIGCYCLWHYYWHY